MSTIDNNHKDFLPFTNDFIFGMVMRDPNVCLGFLKAVCMGYALMPMRKHRKNVLKSRCRL